MIRLTQGPRGCDVSPRQHRIALRAVFVALIVVSAAWGLCGCGDGPDAIGALPHGWIIRTNLVGEFRWVDDDGYMSVLTYKNRDECVERAVSFRDYMKSNDKMNWHDEVTQVASTNVAMGDYTYGASDVTEHIRVEWLGINPNNYDMTTVDGTNRYIQRGYRFDGVMVWRLGDEVTP